MWHSLFTAAHRWLQGLLTCHVFPCHRNYCSHRRAASFECFKSVSAYSSTDSACVVWCTPPQLEKRTRPGLRPLTKTSSSWCNYSRQCIRSTLTKRERERIVYLTAPLSESTPRSRPSAVVSGVCGHCFQAAGDTAGSGAKKITGTKCLRKRCFVSWPKKQALYFKCIPVGRNYCWVRSNSFIPSPERKVNSQLSSAAFLAAWSRPICFAGKACVIIFLALYPLVCVGSVGRFLRKALVYPSRLSSYPPLDRS